MIVDRPFDDAAEMANTVAHDIAAHLRAAVAARGAASFVATGGVTPRTLYETLAHCDVPWPKLTVTLSDERWVAPDHAASNEGLVRRTLLNAGAIRFVALKTPEAKPALAIDVVDRAIRRMPRPFDVCLLGVGADGHIASLFPGAAGFDRAMTATMDDPLVHDVHAPDAAGAADRMTLTLAALLGSRLIVVMFTGAAKWAVYREAKAGLGDTPLRTLFARAVSPVWVCWSPEGLP